VGTEVSFLGVKQLGREADYLLHLC